MALTQTKIKIEGKCIKHFFLGITGELLKYLKNDFFFPKCLNGE
jgi:hypothetical protein